jgi:chorismate mutase-like protein
MNISDWRDRIDELDRKLVDLLNDRASAAREIGLLKRDNQTPIYEPDREKQIFQNVRANNRGPLPDQDLQHIYERIIDVMRKLQREQAQPPQARAANSAGDTELEAEVNE